MPKAERILERYNLRTASSLSVDMKRFEHELKEYAEDLIDSSIRRVERAKAAGHDPSKLAARAQEFLGPSGDIDRLRMGDVRAVYPVFKALIDVSLKDLVPREKWDDLVKLRSDIMAWEDATTEESPEKIRNDITIGINDNIQKSKKNAARVLAQIKSAIQRMKLPMSSPIVIRPSRSSDSGGDAAETFHVVVGQHDAGFTVFTKDGQIELIDDVLEGGDTDFFKDPMEQAVYFDLVKELRNPGSTSRSGKMLTLWTARPSKDRSRYEGARTVPTNIFLTNDPDRAFGLSLDLGGTRDVWKVVIDENYLVETLHAGHIRDYQVVGGASVPVKKLILDMPGE